MKEIPILFNTQMVKAILDGHKTQTRRPVLPLPEMVTDRAVLPWDGAPVALLKLLTESKTHRNPFGQTGDVLWVREAFACGWHQCPWIRMPHKMKPDGTDCAVWREAFERDGRSQPAWKPSIHMPKWACRIKLVVKRVWVERVQDISEEDAIAEGVVVDDAGTCPVYALPSGGWSDEPEVAYGELWDSIYGNWDENPWVWCCEFEVMEVTA